MATFSKEFIEELKQDGLSFEQIESLKQGMQDFEDGNYVDEETFWNEVYKQINNNMLKREQNV